MAILNARRVLLAWEAAHCQPDRSLFRHNTRKRFDHSSLNTPLRSIVRDIKWLQAPKDNDCSVGRGLGLVDDDECFLPRFGR